MSYHDRVLGEASNTALKEFRESPLAYYEWVTGPDKDSTPPMREGTAFHLALHEPGKFARKYIAVPDMPLKSKEEKHLYVSTMLSYIGERGEWQGEKADELRKALTSRLASCGVHVLTDSSLATMRKMVASLNKPCHRVARSFVACGKKEVELRWKDPESGINCKALLDSWEEERGVLSDLKRTVEITERAFKRSCYQREYHFQMAMYRRALRAHSEEPRYSCFTCASPEPPYYWAVYHINTEAVDACDRRIQENLNSLAECMNKNEWPTINNGEARAIEINEEYI
jgi:hypothetical protein